MTTGQPPGIGETLRAARRQLGATLADAAAETRVRETYLAALEEEEFSVLGGEVYARGFLRSYARFLGLDPEPLLAAYEETYGPREEQAFPQDSVGPMEQPRPPGLGILAALAVVLVIVVAAVGLRASVNAPDVGPVAPAPEPGTPPAESARPESALTGAATPGPTAAEPAPTATSSPEAMTSLDVTFTVSGEEAWMRVTVDGSVEREGPQPSGTTASYQPQQDIELRVGDAAHVRISVNGEDLGDLGEPGQVVVVHCAIGASACSREVVA